MAVIEAQIRKIGSSAGVLLPKKLLDEKHLKIGDKVELSIMSSALSPEKKRLLDKALGFTKGKSKYPFKREKEDRF